jgi:flavin reductase (DIM6/NTAB) family NADH-FMN oxidoreductase RutF
VKPGEDPFAGVETFQTPGGVPAMKSALAWLEGRLIHTCDFLGDHELLIAEVVAGNILHPGSAFTHQRGSGFHY